MSLQSQALSGSGLFKILATLSIANTTHHLAKLEAINSILSSDLHGQQLRTVVYFGTSYEIEHYSAVLPGIPKVVCTDSTQDFVFAASAYNRNVGFISLQKSLRRKSRRRQLSTAFASMQSKVRGIFLVPSAEGRSSRRDAYDLQQHFEWCWRQGFTYALALLPHAAALRYDIYGYTRFPDLQVRRLRRQPKELFFADKFADLRGYKVRTSVQHDPPRVFELYDRQRHRVRVAGYAACLLRAFLSKHKGDLQVVQVRSNSSSYDIPGAIELLLSGSIDISMNPYISQPGVPISYPIRMTKWCLLVPFSGEIAPYEYFLRPFRAAVWFACVAGLFYLGSVSALSRWAHAHGRVQIEFCSAFLLQLRVMLFLPVTDNRHRGRPALLRPLYCLGFLLAMLFGFIISNLYLALLTSFLAKSIYKRQLDTISEMVESNLSINALAHEIPVILRSRGLVTGFADLLIARRAPELLRELLDLKVTGEGYAVRQDTIEFVVLQQSLMQHPVFHVAAECLVTVPLGFMMPQHSQFEQALNHFVLRAASAGLTGKWFQDSLSDGVLAGLLHVRRDNVATKRPLRLQHFQFAWFVLFGGHGFDAFYPANQCTVYLTT